MIHKTIKISISKPIIADNCPSHKPIKFDNVELIFYPKNTTPHLECLDEIYKDELFDVLIFCS